MKLELLNKLNDKTAKIGILGLGYVGLPLALRYSEFGFKNVMGFDVDNEKIESILNNKTYIKQFPDEMIESATSKGFSATSDFSKLNDMDAIILCVPTPLNKYREPDISFITNSMDQHVVPNLRRGQILSLESTTYPGTTEEELETRIEKAGFKVGEDYFVIYSPEREDPGNKNFNTQTIPKVVGGTTENCLEVGATLYEGVIDKVVKVSSTKAAEMTKLLENIHRAVNIGLVNEMKIVADKMGIDIFEVIDAAATKPFGFTPYYPGPGLGGHCIPIDPFYLTWKAREFGVHTRFIELAGEVNSHMPEYVIGKVLSALNNVGKAVNGSKILLLGLAYKKNVGDTRESPSVELMEQLVKLGAAVDYSDPFVPNFPKMREHNFDLSSVNLTPNTLQKYDCVLLATDHDNFDYETIASHSKIIIDTRGKFRRLNKKAVAA